MTGMGLEERLKEEKQDRRLRRVGYVALIAVSLWIGYSLGHHQGIEDNRQQVAEALTGIDYAEPFLTPVAPGGAGKDHSP